MNSWRWYVLGGTIDRVASPHILPIRFQPMANDSGPEVFDESLCKGTKRALKLAEAGEWDSSLTTFYQALEEERGRSKRSNSSALVKDCNR